MWFLSVRFQSTRIMPRSSRIGLAAIDTTLPEGDVGTYLSRFCATGLIQPAAILFPETHGFPLVSVSGLPVTASVGLVRVTPAAVKSPARSASLGTRAWTLSAS